MATDEQVNAFINAFELNGGHYSLVNVRKALEAYEDSKWVKFDIPCDICEKELDYHPKHFSSSTNPHVHVCDACISELNYERFFIDSTPPTQEPLRAQEINEIVEDVLPHGTIFDLVRAIERAHGIGTTNEST